jgi:hypothetical protein
MRRGGQVLLGQAAAEPTVGDDIVEIGHHLGLGHRRQPGQVPGLEPAQIQPAQGRAWNGEYSAAYASSTRSRSR